MIATVSVQKTFWSQNIFTAVIVSESSVMHRLSKEVRRRSGNSQFALDNALINEFGYGNHTIDRGIVTYLNIHSLCTLYISALQLVIVLTPDADQHLQLSYKEREDTFLIKLRDIRHIETNRNPLPHKSRLYREEREVVRRTTYIYLRGDRGW